MCSSGCVSCARVCALLSRACTCVCAAIRWRRRLHDMPVLPLRCDPLDVYVLRRGEPSPSPISILDGPSISTGHLSGMILLQDHKVCPMCDTEVVPSAIRRYGEEVKNHCTGVSLPASIFNMRDLYLECARWGFWVTLHPLPRVLYVCVACGRGGDPHPYAALRVRRRQCR